MNGPAAGTAKDALAVTTPARPSGRSAAVRFDAACTLPEKRTVAPGSSQPSFQWAFATAPATVSA